MTAYYNEIDPSAAQWLRNLIEEGHIAPGIVDERSIEDVVPTELMGYTQCHFFAGVGVWSYALRAAGWPDDRPVWTGSCPCQPFSAAGKGAGFADERHLWPAFNHLISQCRPAIVLGEQVASKDADAWIDLVHTDLEALGYAFGAVPFPAAGVGAPHIRDRLYWVADTERERVRPLGRSEDAGTARSMQGSNGKRERVWPDAGELRGICGLADPQQHHRGSQAAPAHHEQQETDGPSDWAGGCGVLLGRVADAERIGHSEHQRDAGAMGGPPDRSENAQPESWRASQEAFHRGEDGRPGPTNGHWRDADWLLCRDGKWRPVEPGTFPLVDGLPRSMGHMPPELRRLAEVAGLDKKSLARAKSWRIDGLKGYGNAINAKAAKAFIECVMPPA